MSEAGDVWREASDPTTPAERLEAIRQWVTQERIWREASELGEVDAIERAILGHPALPLDTLGRALLQRDTLRRVGPAAWFNPSTPRLLGETPLDAHRQAAADALEHAVASGMESTLTLEAQLARAAARLRAGSIGAPERPRVERLARHLAGLFGLVWPSG